AVRLPALPCDTSSPPPFYSGPGAGRSAPEVHPRSAGAVGDGGVVEAARRPGTLSGHEHARAVRADAERVGVVGAVAGSVVALDPQPRAGRGVVTDGGIVLLAREDGGAPTCHEYLRAVRADPKRSRLVDVVGRPVVVRQPELRAGGGVVGDRRVVVVVGRAVVQPAGHEQLGAVRADAKRAGDVVADLPSPAKALHPQLRAA